MQKIYYYIAQDIKINYCSPGEDGTSSEVGDRSDSASATTSSSASGGQQRVGAESVSDSTSTIQNQRYQIRILYYETIAIMF